MNHQDLAKYWLIRDDEGNVLSVNTEEAEPAKIVFTEGSVAPEWYNVLRASGAMYQQLTAQYKALQALIELGETAGVNEELLSHFTNMQNGILLAQLVAIEGVEKVSASIDAQNKTS
mgnify:CR=1 FL=1